MKRWFFSLVCLAACFPTFSQPDESHNRSVVHWTNPEQFYSAVHGNPVLSAYLLDQDIHLFVRVNEASEPVKAWTRDPLDPALLDLLLPIVRKIQFEQDIISRTGADCQELEIVIRHSHASEYPIRHASKSSFEDLLQEGLAHLDQGNYDSARILFNGIVHGVNALTFKDRFEEITAQARLFRAYSSLYVGDWATAEDDFTELIGAARLAGRTNEFIDQLSLARGFARAQQEKYAAAFSDWYGLARQPDVLHEIWFSNLFGHGLSASVIEARISRLMPLFQQEHLSPWLPDLLNGFQQIGPAGFMVMNSL